MSELSGQRSRDGAERTPEQHDAVRRRALPLAACALIIGAISVGMLVLRPAGGDRPPAALAGPLAYCAILMGAGLLFYAKGTPRTAFARGASILAIVLGLAGTMLYAKQTVDLRGGMEKRELQNVREIALAAKKYAEDKGGQYPPDFAALLQGNYLEPERLLSPYAGAGTEYIQKEKLSLDTPQGRAAVAGHADYTYVGGDLKAGIDKEAASQIIVVYKTEPVMRVHFAVGFVDGSGRFLRLEEAQEALAKTNAARKALGLPELIRPGAIERAEKGEVQK
jgi:hypothetical protein